MSDEQTKELRVFVIWQPYHDGTRTIARKVLGIAIAPDKQTAKRDVPLSVINQHLPYYDDYEACDIGPAIADEETGRHFLVMPGTFT